MRKIVIVAVIALGAAVGGGTGYAVFGPGIDTPPTEAETRTHIKPRESSPKRGGGGGESGQRSEVIERLEVGMSRAQVLAIAGPADREDTMSTDFGHDVALWYGSWEVWLSNRVVRSISHYPKA